MATEFDSRYTQYQLDRSYVRRMIRQAYLRRAASLAKGRTLDFGCGVGELLRRLPAGSKGLEYNAATVEHCRSQGLHVDGYDGFADDWNLSVLEPDATFESLVVSHVLEHLEDPLGIFKKLLRSVASTGVTRAVVIVPGRAGFRIDPTHLKFVDRAMLGDESIPAETGFIRIHETFFPGNLRWIGDWFPYHELQVVYERQSAS